MITILEGSTFCLSDDDGQIAAGLTGLFADDTRFLSRLELTIEGARPLLLGSGNVEYFNAAIFLRNAVTPKLPRDTVSIARRRFVARGLSERIVIRNEGAHRLCFDGLLSLGADFVDVISLKASAFAWEAGEQAPKLPEPCVPVAQSPDLLLIDDPGSELLTWISTSRDIVVVDGAIPLRLDLEPGEGWELALEIVPGRDGEERVSSGTEPSFGRERHHVLRAVDAFGLVVPGLLATSRSLETVYRRSIADLASLRLRGFGAEGELPAAGMPWFMTLFGRDTLITSYETLLFGPRLATGALRSLAALQATGDHPEADAEPGKIPHEVRRGKAAAAWFPIYYGSVDATPLFLILLSEVWRWTGDDALVRELEIPARRALDWIERYGDRDGDGFVEYERRTPRGLENQSWKDSGDSQRFSDGSIARPPIAPAEVQGYVYDAWCRSAELAVSVWDDVALARRLERSAQDLASRFDSAFWLPERQTYALALDGEKRQVDAVCSNTGHLLWSGIVPAERASDVASVLQSPSMSSGWGVRTMSSDEVAYNPISYHNGTVWPHDTALCAAGLLRYGFHSAADALCQALFDAAESLDGSLPEVFAGFDRSETPFVVGYPTASQPQAWAAGAPILCLQTVLGIHADPDAGLLAAPTAPAWLGDLVLTGIPARGRTWTVKVENGAIGVEELT